MSSLPIASFVGKRLIVHALASTRSVMASRGEFVLEEAVRHQALLRPIDSTSRALAWALLTETGSRVELVWPLGQSAFAGTAMVLRWSPSKLLVVTNPEHLEQRELRTARRVQVVVPALVAVNGAAAVRVGETRDVSTSGIAMVADGHIPGLVAGTEVTLTLVLADGDLVAGATVVAGDDIAPDRTLIRMALQHGCKDDEQRLATYLLQVEQAATRVTATGA